MEIPPVGSARQPFYNAKLGYLDIPGMVKHVCTHPHGSALELTKINDFIGKLKKSQLGDALTAVRAVVAALKPLDDLLKDEVLRKTNRSFETDLSHVDIVHSEDQRLDIPTIRQDMGPKWIKKYTKKIPKTTVTALTLERWKTLNEKRATAAKKAGKVAKAKRKAA